VLVVDGFDDSREATAAELRASGHDVLAVAEEEEAVAATGSKSVDVVLLDLPLAEVVDAVRTLRAHPPTARSRVVAVVHPTDSRDARDAARAAGIDYFFLRPCPPREVVKQLRRLLRT
jgi:DNA-binding response OmpR family regulator